MSSSSSINSSSNQILPEDRRESSEPSSSSSNAHSMNSSNKEIAVLDRESKRPNNWRQRLAKRKLGLGRQEVEEPEEDNQEENATEAEVAEDNLEASDPLFATTSKAKSPILEENGLSDKVIFIIPEAEDRPWDVPEGFLCIYVTYFTQCRLSLPIPSRLLGYCNRRGVALTQVMPASITNYVGFVTLCDELGEVPTSRLFEDLFSVNIHKSKEWFFAANAKPRKNLVTGVKPSKYNNWESQYFYLEMNDLSVSNSDIPTQSEWKIPIGRHLPSIILNSGLTSEFETAFSEAGKRRWPEVWEEILQRRAKKAAPVKEPKPLKPKTRAKKPRAAPRRKAPKPQAKRPRTARMLSLDEIPTLLDEEEPNVADPTPVPATEGTNEQPKELPPAANSPDQAGQKKLKKKKSSKKTKRIEDSSRAQDAPAELNPPTAMASDLALSQDRAEASHSRKRQAEDHTEDSPGPEPAKRAKTVLIMMRRLLLRRTSMLAPNSITKSLLRSRVCRQFPSSASPICTKGSHLASQTNNLVAAYEVGLYDEQVRVAELQERVSKAEERLATELQINDSLHTAVELLKQESSELKAVRTELTEAQTLLSREFEKDKERLQGAEQGAFMRRPANTWRSLSAVWMTWIELVSLTWWLISSLESSALSSNSRRKACTRSRGSWHRGKACQGV
ncbi:meiosis-specific protein ASY2-like [Eutrema salsugineum]|uniref:meiosis-specific protein ASY2-like n=1 Tax=Eutrema salsugineum TaxID=72664 RepID=UPI000CED209F|nr:meiosis-specific protein ASY2-like [Eutrema salsugineum]